MAVYQDFRVVVSAKYFLADLDSGVKPPPRLLASVVMCPYVMIPYMRVSFGHVLFIVAFAAYVYNARYAGIRPVI